MIFVVLGAVPVLLVASLMVRVAHIVSCLGTTAAASLLATSTSVSVAALMALTMVSVGTGRVAQELSLQVIQTGLNQTFHLLFLTILALLLKIYAGDPELNLNRREAEGASLIKRANSSLSHIDCFVQNKGVLEARRRINI